MITRAVNHSRDSARDDYVVETQLKILQTKYAVLLTKIETYQCCNFLSLLNWLRDPIMSGPRS